MLIHNCICSQRLLTTAILCAENTTASAFLVNLLFDLTQRLGNERRLRAVLFKLQASRQLVAESSKTLNRSSLPMTGWLYCCHGLGIQGYDRTRQGDLHVLLLASSRSL
jgi:hypothetical protein